MRKCSALPFGTAFGDAPGVASFSCICWWGHGPLCRWSKMTTVRQAWLWGWQISCALAPYLVWRYHVLVSVVRMKQGAKQDFPRPKRNLTGSVILESFQGGLLGHSANGWSCFLCVSPLTPFKLKAIFAFEGRWKTSYWYQEWYPMPLLLSGVCLPALAGDAFTLSTSKEILGGFFVPNIVTKWHV